MSEPTIFTKIIAREIPAQIRYEDDQFLAFDDISPKAPIHVLLIPKTEYASLEAVDLADDQFHAKLLQTARKVANELGISDNYKLMMNVGRNVQAVHHIHVHILGGWKSTDQPDEMVEV